MSVMAVDKTNKLKKRRRILRLGIIRRTTFNHHYTRIDNMVDTWTKLLPRDLFTAKDGSPICALLDVEDGATSKILSEMFESRGGSVIKTSPTPYAIILTDRSRGHSRITIEHKEYPVFDVKWIVDCIDSAELVNINPYLLNKYIFEGRNFMEVIYEKLETSKGTLVVDNVHVSSDCDWKTTDKKNHPGKKTRRRGPPKTGGYVLIELKSLSRDEDVYCEIANFAITKAIQSKKVNERIQLSKTKEELKRHDPDVENRIFRKNLQSLLSEDKTCVDLSNSNSTTGDVHLLQPSSHQPQPKASDEYLVTPLKSDGGGQVGLAKPKMKNSYSPPRNSLHCYDNVLPLSSRICPASKDSK